MWLKSTHKPALPAWAAMASLRVGSVHIVTSVPTPVPVTHWGLSCFWRLLPQPSWAGGRGTALTPRWIPKAGRRSARCPLWEAVQQLEVRRPALSLGTSRGSPRWQQLEGLQVEPCRGARLQVQVADLGRHSAQRTPTGSSTFSSAVGWVHATRSKKDASPHGHGCYELVCLLQPSEIIKYIYTHI